MLFVPTGNVTENGSGTVKSPGAAKEEQNAYSGRNHKTLKYRD